jgi:predicted metal-binding transcription factor (methanogenesis marker protein 9)
MAKKVIINESTLKKIINNQILNESELSKNDVSVIIKDTIKNDREVKKEIEKQVKDLVAKTVNTLFRTLWQRRNFYEDEIKK